MSRQTLIDGIRRDLAMTAGVDLAILFGSRARGDARPDSDADLAVLGHGVDFIALAAGLERAVGMSVDVVDLDRAPYPLTLAVLRDGAPVFEREVGAYARFVSRSLAELETDLPNLRSMQRAFVEHVAAHGLASSDR